MTFLIDLAKKALAQSPTRFVAYGSALAVAAALKIAEALGVTLTAEVLAAVAAIATFVITELIRQFVFAPSTTQQIVDRAAATGVTDIGKPPSGEA